MNLRNVKNLEGKMRICNIIYPVGVVTGVLSLFAGYIVIQTSYGLGVFLCGLAVVLALIAGIAQVMESYLYVEEMDRITGRRPRNKKGTMYQAQSFISWYAQTEGRISMEDAQELGKELNEEFKDEKEKKGTC